LTGKSGNFDGGGVTFQYPKDWGNLTRLVPAHAPRGHPLWSAILGTGRREFALVAAYPGRDPRSDAARRRDAEQVARDLAEQLGATPAGAAFLVDGVFPSFGYTVVGEPTGEPSVRIDGYLLFGPRVRYVIQCQSPNPNDAFGGSCAEILGTFRPTATGVGATSPLAASQSLFRDAREQRFDLAHRVATDDAVREMIGMDPSLQPPETCFTSDASSGPLCEATNPGLFSVQFATQRFGGRWFVIRVFHCTLYGNERNCWSASP
jgi:hypothetical protein